MTNTYKRHPSLPTSNLINLHFPATDNDILKEIKTTNELLKIMINIMLENRYDQENYNKLLDEKYDKSMTEKLRDIEETQNK
jgi:hypothetical protein